VVDPVNLAGVYREALRHRPDWPATYVHLGNALKDIGLREETTRCWKEALRLEPENRQARDALGQASANGIGKGAGVVTF
jgi:predicted TPR repeat methyltransferase